MSVEWKTLVIWGFNFVGVLVIVVLVAITLARRKDKSKAIIYQPLAKQPTQWLGLICFLPGLAIPMAMGEERTILTLPMIAGALMVFSIGCGLLIWSERRWPDKPAA